MAFVLSHSSSQKRSMNGELCILGGPDFQMRIGIST